MSDYSKITDFAAKDAMLAGNPLKEITGTAHDNELNAISVAIASKANAASPAITGTPTAVGATWSNLGTVTTADINGGTIDGTTQASGTINGPIAAGGTWTAAAAWTLPAFTLGGTITSNGKSFSGTIADLGTVTTADINGGTIDGAVIGGATPAAGSFTTLGATDGSVSQPSITNIGDVNTGIYFPAEDEVAIGTGGTHRVRVGSTGDVSIGPSSSLTGFRLALWGNTSGVSASQNIMCYAGPTYLSSLDTYTTACFSTYPSTEAATFTLPSLFHFRASQGTLGAGSTVTEQVGFEALASLIGATTNYGFRTNNAAAVTSGKTHYSFYAGNNVATGGGTTWNFFAGGTAPNYFAGVVKTKTTISVGDETPAASGAGITFPATQSASSDANTLDDYEEGTFTPAIYDNTLSAAEGQTYTTAVGTFTKSGNVVHVQGRITLSSLGTLTGGEQARLGGLPYATSSTANNYSALNIGYAAGLAVTAGNSISGHFLVGQTHVALNKWSATTGITPLSLTELSADGDFIFSGTYVV